MAKINIEDIDKKPLPRKKPISFGSIWQSIKSFFKILFGEFKKLDLKKLPEWIQNINIYARIREILIRFYLIRSVSMNKETLVVRRQPLIFIPIKITLVSVSLIVFYFLHPILGDLLTSLSMWIGLHRIQYFDFLTKDFFYLIAQILFLVIIIYFGLYFIFHQIKALIKALTNKDPEQNRYYLETHSIKRENLLITWQPLLLIFTKVAIVAFISYLFYLLHPIVGDWLEQGFLFFRLHEIYNFDFPGKSFFQMIAEYLFLFIIGYHGIFFLFHQFQALFSSLAVSRLDKKVYYIKNHLIKKELFVFSVPEMEIFRLKQNILYRLLGIGTITIQKKSGETVIIKSLKNAPQVMKYITSINDSISQNGTSN